MPCVCVLYKDLTLPQVEFPANDLHTLVEKQHKYQWGFLGDSIIETFLEQASDSAVYRCRTVLYCAVLYCAVLYLYSAILGQGHRHTADQLLPGGQVGCG